MKPLAPACGRQAKGGASGRCKDDYRAGFPPAIPLRRGRQRGHPADLPAKQCLPNLGLSLLGVRLFLFRREFNFSLFVLRVQEREEEKSDKDRISPQFQLGPHISYEG